MQDDPIQPAESLPRIGVVVCEDCSVTRTFLVNGLSVMGMDAVGVVDGVELDDALKVRTFELLVLDILLPGEDGFSIAQRMRQAHPLMGIVMLTAVDPVEDRIRGLEGGADLYYVKPVDIRELAAALKALWRRLSMLERRSKPRGAWRLVAEKSMLVAPNHQCVALTHNELQFLSVVFAEAGAPVSRERIAEALGHPPDHYGQRRVDTLISRLRQKVKEEARGLDLPIKARHNLGYVLLREA